MACFAEYVFHLTRLNPDMMYLHQDSGLMNIAYFKFDVDDGTGTSTPYLIVLKNKFVLYHFDELVKFF